MSCLTIFKIHFCTTIPNSKCQCQMNRNMKSLLELTSTVVKIKSPITAIARTPTRLRCDNKSDDGDDIEKKREYDKLKPLSEEPIEAQRIAKGLTKDMQTGVSPLESRGQALEKEYFHKKTQDELKQIKEKLEEAARKSLEKQAIENMEKKNKKS